MDIGQRRIATQKNRTVCIFRLCTRECSVAVSLNIMMVTAVDTGLHSRHLVSFCLNQLELFCILLFHESIFVGSKRPFGTWSPRVGVSLRPLPKWFTQMNAPQRRSLPKRRSLYRNAGLCLSVALCRNAMLQRRSSPPHRAAKKEKKRKLSQRRSVRRDAAVAAVCQNTGTVNVEATPVATVTVMKVVTIVVAVDVTIVR